MCTDNVGMDVDMDLNMNTDIELGYGHVCEKISQYFLPAVCKLSLRFVLRFVSMLVSDR
jgi:hypothetical protein